MLNIENIKKSYGNQLVLEDINLSINKPRLIALIAPNGSGKTTLLNIICNLEKADSGVVTVKNTPNNKVEIFEKLSFMQDNSVLYSELTGMDHVKLIQAVYSLNQDTVDQVLSDLNMFDYISKKVKNYSLGMKQHLLFALAILPNPDVLLLDEPLNGLDPASVVKVRNSLISLHKKGTTILFSSHNLEQIDKLTNDIYFLKNGNLISYDEIIKHKESRVFKVITDFPDKLVSYAQNLACEVKVVSRYTCHIKCSLKQIQKIKKLDTLMIFEVCEIENSLEQIYFELYKDYDYEPIQI